MGVMAKAKTLYSDRDYLEARFSSKDEKLDKIIELQEKQDERIALLEAEVGGAKLLGKAALGVAAVFGGVVTWVVNIGDKVLPHIKG